MRAHGLVRVLRRVVIVVDAPAALQHLMRQRHVCDPSRADGPMSTAPPSRIVSDDRPNGLKNNRRRTGMWLAREGLASGGPSTQRDESCAKPKQRHRSRLGDRNRFEVLVFADL